jgi:nucleoid DNA-binding protein
MRKTDVEIAKDALVEQLANQFNLTAKDSAEITSAIKDLIEAMIDRAAEKHQREILTKILCNFQLHR